MIVYPAEDVALNCHSCFMTAVFGQLQIARLAHLGLLLVSIRSDAAASPGYRLDCWETSWTPASACHPISPLPNTQTCPWGLKEGSLHRWPSAYQTAWLKGKELPGLVKNGLDS